MVSPPYKEGFQILATGVSQDGSQLRVESPGNFLTPERTIPEGTGALQHTYRLVRTEAGWESLPVDAPFSRFPDVVVSTLSPDFGSSLWFASAPGQSSADVYLDLSGGPVRMGPGAPPGALEAVLNFAGASKDLRHVLFIVHSASAGLEEEHLWPGDTTLGERRPSLYEYSGTGHSEPGLVGVSDEHKLVHVGESHLISDCGTVLGSFPQGDAYNAVSASGATVFFTSEACAGAPSVDELYARIDQERTVAISEPESVPGRICTGACAAAESLPGNRKPGVFAGASLDGSRVFFLTSQPLVDADTDSGIDLYAADLGEGAVRSLVQVSRGGEGDITPGSGAGVQGVARVSEDGSHVYFVAQGALTGMNREGKAPGVGEPNLYVSVRECPGEVSSCANPVERTSFVATLSGADSEDWGAQDRRPVQTTPDGRFLVFQSVANLTPDQEGRKEAGQIFEYDAQTETLVRVSHGQDGFEENGNSSVYPAAIPIQGYKVDAPDARFTGLAVSSDGSRVFFSSADALTPQALKGVTNIYEYSGGQVALISDGHDVATISGRTLTELIGTDESGSNVFFTTADRLVAQDRDTWVDVYDARIEGGFAPSAESAPCSGDSCQGAGSMAPSLLMPGVSSDAGEPAVAGRVKQKVKVIRKKPKRPGKLKKDRRSARKQGRHRSGKTAGRGRSRP